MIFRTIEAVLTIISVRTIARADFPNVWVVVLHWLLLAFEWSQCFILIDQKFTVISEVNNHLCLNTFFCIGHINVPLWTLLAFQFTVTEQVRACSTCCVFYCIRLIDGTNIRIWMCFEKLWYFSIFIVNCGSIHVENFWSLKIGKNVNFSLACLVVAKIYTITNLTLQSFNIEIFIILAKETISQITVVFLIGARSDNSLRVVINGLDQWLLVLGNCYFGSC